MKLLGIYPLLVAAQDPSDWPMPSSAPTPVPTTMSTTPPPAVEMQDRCQDLSFARKNGPEPSSGTMCPKYKCYSCCDDDKARKGFEEKAVFNAEGKMKRFGPYHFEGCSGSANGSNGAMSTKCQTFVTNNFCLSSCSPNVYPFIEKGEKRLDSIPVCDNYCNDFYEACKDDYICYNKEGLKEYIIDFIDGTVKDNYKVFECEGEYTCKQIADSLISTPPSPDKVPEGLRARYEKAYEAAQAERSNSERFCENFSFRMFKVVEQQGNVDDRIDMCIDPRYEETVVSAVRIRQDIYNKLNPNDQKTFVTSEPCPTGLSVGAIVGIVFGVLIGVGLIAGLVWYFACRKPNEGYDQGQQNVDDAGTYDMPVTKPPKDSVRSENDSVPQGSIVRSEADYDPSESMRNKK